jgi:hypothetical protein
VRNLVEGLIKGLKVICQRIVAVQVERRSHPLGNGFYRHAFAVKLAILVLKVMHGDPDPQEMACGKKNNSCPVFRR